MDPKRGSCALQKLPSFCIGQIGQTREARSSTAWSMAPAAGAVLAEVAPGACRVLMRGSGLRLVVLVLVRLLGARAVAANIRQPITGITGHKETGSQSRMQLSAR